MRTFAFVLVTLLTETATATAEDVAPSDPLLGVGYKIGNGIGFLGADILVTPLPHVSLDVHVAYAPGFDSAYAMAPALQAHLFTGRSTPYAAVGMQYVWARLGEVTASGTGFFANLGYEWKWTWGLGVQLGGGVQRLNEISATDGTRTATVGGKVAPNLEVGLRYRFF
jgi:hypothetical protein